MTTYRVEVTRNSTGLGSCNVSTCDKFGNISVTFRDVAAFACTDAHALDAPIELVRARIRRNVSRFRVQTYVSRWVEVETTLATSECVLNDNEAVPFVRAPRWFAQVEGVDDVEAPSR